MEGWAEIIEPTEEELDECEGRKVPFALLLPAALPLRWCESVEAEGETAEELVGMEDMLDEGSMLAAVGGV